MKLSPLAVLLLALGGAAHAPEAAAQYQWRDENGRMVFSDRPPPGSVPAGNLMRTPVRPPTGAAPSAGATSASEAGASAVATAPAAVGGENSKAASASAPGLADRALEQRRRQAERAAQEKAEADQRAANERQARACEASRDALRALDSGMRVARVNAQGEREFLSDEERERRAAELRRDMKDSCKSS